MWQQFSHAQYAAVLCNDPEDGLKKYTIGKNI